jgi:hypothetical protein
MMDDGESPLVGIDSGKLKQCSSLLISIPTSCVTFFIPDPTCVLRKFTEVGPCVSLVTDLASSATSLTPCAKTLAQMVGCAANPIIPLALACASNLLFDSLSCVNVLYNALPK